MRYLKWTGPALLGTAAAGGLGTDVRSGWYEQLDLPPWQPPRWAFGPAWTTLYILIALASARTLERMENEDERRAYGRALAVNLGLNVAWTWIFFTAKRPRWSMAEILALELSNLDLIRRSVRVDRVAAGMLVPYAAWTAFASTLNAAIVARNPQA
jgi:tryptophan-rich sensory protein